MPRFTTPATSVGTPTFRTSAPRREVFDSSSLAPLLALGVETAGEVGNQFAVGRVQDEAETLQEQTRLDREREVQLVEDLDQAQQAGDQAAFDALKFESIRLSQGQATGRIGSAEAATRLQSRVAEEIRKRPYMASRFISVARASGVGTSAASGRSGGQTPFQEALESYQKDRLETFLTLEGRASLKQIDTFLADQRASEIEKSRFERFQLGGAPVGGFRDMVDNQLMRSFEESTQNFMVDLSRGGLTPTEQAQGLVAIQEAGVRLKASLREMAAQQFIDSSRTYISPRPQEGVVSQGFLNTAEGQAYIVQKETEIDAWTSALQETYGLDPDDLDQGKLLERIDQVASSLTKAELLASMGDAQAWARSILAGTIPGGQGGQGGGVGAHTVIDIIGEVIDVERRFEGLSTIDQRAAFAQANPTGFALMTALRSKQYKKAWDSYNQLTAEMMRELDNIGSVRILDDVFKQFAGHVTFRVVESEQSQMKEIPSGNQRPIIHQVADQMAEKIVGGLNDNTEMPQDVAPVITARSFSNLEETTQGDLNKFLDTRRAQIKGRADLIRDKFDVRTVGGQIKLVARPEQTDIGENLVFQGDIQPVPLIDPDRLEFIENYIRLGVWAGRGTAQEIWSDLVTPLSEQLSQEELEEQRKLDAQTPPFTQRESRDGGRTIPFSELN